MTRWQRVVDWCTPLVGFRPWRQHSSVLAVGGLAYMLFGLVYVLTPMTVTRADGLTLPLRLAPIETWGTVWVLFGALALASTVWPPTSETWGYVALSSLSAVWSAAYAFGIPLGAPVSNVFGVLVWALFGFLWWRISGLRNPEIMLNPEAATLEGA